MTPGQRVYVDWPSTPPTGRTRRNVAPPRGLFSPHSRPPLRSCDRARDRQAKSQMVALRVRQSGEPVSLTGRRLPQFDHVSLRIDDPAKGAVVGLVDLVEDVAAFRLERGDQAAKVFNAVVDHERGFAWSKLLGFLRRNQPGGRSAGGLAIPVGPVERGTAPRLDIDSEMTLVPRLQRRCILCLEKNAADASYSLHVDLLCAVVEHGDPALASADCASPFRVIFAKTVKNYPFRRSSASSARSPSAIGRGSKRRA